MVSTTKKMESISVVADVKHDFCSVFCSDSGIGKSHYIDIVCDSLEESGLLTLHVMYNNRKMLESVYSGSVKPFLLVLDELEFYEEDADLDSLKANCDNLWVLHRGFSTTISDCLDLASIIHVESDDERVVFHD